MRRLVIAAVAAAVLVVAPAAAAKEVTSATVCGTDGCTTTQNRFLLPALMDGGPSADPPQHPSGAIRVKAKIVEPGGDAVGGFTTWWVPGTQLLLSPDGSWQTLSPRATEAIASAAHNHKPFGPERLGSSFAGTSSHAGPPPPVHTQATGDDGSGIGWAAIAAGIAVALAAAGLGVLLVRRRPGGATP